MNITDLINELQMPQSLGYTKVIWAKPNWIEGGNKIDVTYSQSKDGELGDIVLEISGEE